MKNLLLGESGRPLIILCFGAHSDDIEIGIGGTILGLIEAGVELHAHWCVCSANGLRADEGEASASSFLEGAISWKIDFGDFRDSYFPSQSEQIKHWMSGIRKRTRPDIIFTHAREDAHQDHREVSQLTWNVFRDDLILEYEIPKWDGDLSRPNIYVPIARATMERKIALLMDHFLTQRSKDWFDPEIFRGLARLRGMECRASDHYAEAFHLRKGVVSLTAPASPANEEAASPSHRPASALQPA